MRVLKQRELSRFGDHIVANLMIGLTLIVLIWHHDRAGAQGQAIPDSRQVEPHTTLVIFADRKMAERDWGELFDGVRRNVAEGAMETQALSGPVEMIRGDSMEVGQRVDGPVLVFLHGDCDLEPHNRRTAYGVPLGWVLRVDGRIEPFVHVDCTRLGQVLGPQAMGLDRDERNALMGRAIGRVVLHEWIHIATQNSSHTERGISKAQFGVADLTAGTALDVARLRSR